MKYLYANFLYFNSFNINASPSSNFMEKLKNRCKIFIHELQTESERDWGCGENNGMG